MWISLLMLLLLLVTPISCRAEIRQEHGTRFRILLRIWGIPLRFDHSQAPMRPKPPSAQQLQKGKALLRALPKLKRPVRLLMRQTALEQLLVHVSLALRDPAATALTTAFLRQIRLLPRLCSRKRRQKRALTAPWHKPPPLRMPPAPQNKR